jgi:hypothetical protein
MKFQASQVTDLRSVIRTIGIGTQKAHRFAKHLTIRFRDFPRRWISSRLAVVWKNETESERFMPGSEKVEGASSDRWPNATKEKRTGYFCHEEQQSPKENEKLKRLIGGVWQSENGGATMCGSNHSNSTTWSSFQTLNSPAPQRQITGSGAIYPRSSDWFQHRECKIVRGLPNSDAALRIRIMIGPNCSINIEIEFDRSIRLDFKWH